MKEQVFLTLERGWARAMGGSTSIMFQARRPEWWVQSEPGSRENKVWDVKKEGARSHSALQITGRTLVIILREWHFCHICVTAPRLTPWIPVFPRSHLTEYRFLSNYFLLCFWGFLVHFLLLPPLFVLSSVLFLACMCLSLTLEAFLKWLILGCPLKPGALKCWVKSLQVWVTSL